MYDHFKYQKPAFTGNSSHEEMHGAFLPIAI